MGNPQNNKALAGLTPSDFAKVVRIISAGSLFITRHNYRAAAFVGIEAALVSIYARALMSGDDKKAAKLKAEIKENRKTFLRLYAIREGNKRLRKQALILENAKAKHKCNTAKNNQFLKRTKKARTVSVKRYEA